MQQKLKSTVKSNQTYCKLNAYKEICSIYPYKSTNYQLRWLFNVIR